MYRYAKVWGARGTAAAGSVLPPCRAVGAAILCCFLNGPWLRSYGHCQCEVNLQSQAHRVLCKGKWTCMIDNLIHYCTTEVMTEVIQMFVSWVSSPKVQSCQSVYKIPLCQCNRIGTLMQQKNPILYRNWCGNLFELSKWSEASVVEVNRICSDVFSPFDLGQSGWPDYVCVHVTHISLCCSGCSGFKWRNGIDDPSVSDPSAAALRILPAAGKQLLPTSTHRVCVRHSRVWVKHFFQSFPRQTDFLFAIC